jgi:hypothetical protein
LEDWVAGTEAAIMDWYHECYRAADANRDAVFESRWKEMKLYASIATPYILVILYRPCPRLRQRTTEDLMKAFFAAVQVADGYWRQSNADFGKIKYVFHPCHHSFSSAIVFLQALQRCKPEIAARYTPTEVEEFIQVFSRFFKTIAERWPAATRCLEEYERLLAPVKRDYLNFLAARGKDVSPHTAMYEPLIGDGPYPSTELDEAFSFWSVFNPASTAEASKDIDTETMPKDWNSEFNFGMDSSSDKYSSSER